MAEFLPTTEISAAIERVIRQAEKELFLISAYVYPRVIYLQRLKDAAKRGVQITFIFGKKRMDEKVFALFKEVPNLKIYYLHELHAKCFVNEREAIVTSLNLLNGSEEKNREMGVRLDHNTDMIAYRECISEVESILAVADLVFSSSNVSKPKSSEKFLASPKPGYCIRTGVEIPFNIEVPYAIKRWKDERNRSRTENYCHFSGEPSNGETNLERPILRKNWKKAQKTFDL